MVTADAIRQGLTCGEPGCACGQPRGHVHCPAHQDDTPSLSVTEKDGKVLVKCFGGCDQARVIEALKARNLWPSGNGGPRVQKPRIVATYDYQDAAGKLIYQVCRFEPGKNGKRKDFRQRRPDGNGGWVWDLKGVVRVPYRLPELLKAETVAVVEGEKDADRLATLGVTATCNSEGAGKWRTEFRQFFQGKKVAILPDNDDPGRAHALQVAENLHGAAAVVKVVELPGLPEQGDISDWIAHGGTFEQLFELVKAAPEWKPPAPSPKPAQEAPKSPPQTGKPKIPAIRFMTGTELQACEFKEPVWVVPGIIPEGLNLLSARPKKGKTWFGLDVSVAKSSGGCAFGKAELRLEQGKVLYLCLEDKLRRAKRRLEKIMGGGPFPEDLVLAESWPRLDRGGLDALRDFLKEHDDCKLVVVDSFAKIKPPRPKNADPYEFDMAVGGALQSLAQEFQICLLLIYHNRKVEADDPLDEVIGGTGLTGAVDAVLVLRRGRGQADATLFITGRDVEEQALSLKFHPQEGLWELMGTAAECAISAERQEILLILREVGPKTPLQLAKIIGKSRESIRMNLMRMKNAGMVTIRENGEYQII